MKKKSDYLIRESFKHMFLMILLMEIADSLGSLIDSIIVGQLLSPLDLSAITVCRPHFLVAKAVAVLLGVGGVLLVTNHMGKNETEEANQIFTLVTGFSIVLGLVLSAVFIIYAGSWMELSGIHRGTRLFETGSAYLTGRSWGMIPYLLGIVLMGFLKIQNGRKLGVIATVITSVSNILMDILFLKYLNMGMFGVGLATALSYLVSVVVGMIYFFSRQCSFRITHIRRPFQLLAGVTKYGLSTAAFRICSAAGLYLLNRIFFKYGGENAITTYAIWTNMVEILALGNLCSAQSLSPMVALFAGEEDLASIKKAIRYAFQVAFQIAVLMLIPILFFAGSIASVFGVTPQHSCYQEVIKAIHTFGFFLFPNIAVILGIDYYNAIGKGILSNIMLVLNKLVLICGISFLFGKFYYAGIWTSFVITEILTCLAVVVIVMFRSKKRPTIQNLLFYKVQIGVDENMQYEKTIRGNVPDAIDFSQEIMTFLISHSVEKKTAVRIQLAIEEITVVISEQMEHWSPDSYMDYRVIIKEERIILCVRYNGKEYNMIDHYKNVPKEDITSNIEIKLLINMASDVKFHYVMGMNHFLLTINQDSSTNSAYGGIRWES